MGKMGDFIDRLGRFPVHDLHHLKRGLLHIGNHCKLSDYN